jgi:aspartate carbamoyltransferase catalytic subunit
MTEFRLRHLLSTRDLSREAATHILDSADAFLEVGRRPIKKVPTLRGKTVINLFYENSTRTRSSFELAGKRMGADVINIGVATSSTKKGESLRDTLETLDAMRPDVIIVRHHASGAAEYLARHSNASIINAGDGMHEHPTQALLDAYTIRQRMGRIEGLKVAICGDILHSRVARSNAWLLRELGAEVRLAGPATMLPHDPEPLECAVYDRLEPAIEGADVVMMLRIQQERLSGSAFSTLREYAQVFGLNAARFSKAADDAIFMHPGPMNRGVEVSEDMVESPRSVVLDQVEAGVAVRMALLYLCVSELDPDAA